MNWNCSPRKCELLASVKGHKRFPEAPWSRDVHFSGNFHIVLPQSDLPYTKFRISPNKSLALLSNVSTLVAYVHYFVRISLGTWWHDHDISGFFPFKVCNIISLQNSKSLQDAESEMYYKYFLLLFLYFYLPRYAWNWYKCIWILKILKNADVKILSTQILHREILNIVIYQFSSLKSVIFLRGKEERIDTESVPLAPYNVSFSLFPWWKSGTFLVKGRLLQ